MKRLGDVRRRPCARRRLSSLAACCARHKWHAFLGFTPASAEELSDAGRASPDTDHAAAAGSGTQTVSHTPRRRAELAWMAETRERGGLRCGRAPAQNQTLAAERVVAAGQKHERTPLPTPHAPRPENSLKRS